MDLSYAISPNFNAGRQGHIPDFVVCHVTEGREPQRPGILPGHVPADWAVEGWLWAMEELGMDGTRPRDGLTRQEAAVLLHRLSGAAEP